MAIGQAIVCEPAAFLFDQPLSNLDAALRVGMRLEISELDISNRSEHRLSFAVSRENGLSPVSSDPRR